MSFESGQLLDQSPNARYDRVHEDMYKLTQALSKHIRQTGCMHCKQILNQSISTNHPDKTVGRDIGSFGMETTDSFTATDVQRTHHNVSVMAENL